MHNEINRIATEAAKSKQEGNNDAARSFLGELYARGVFQKAAQQVVRLLGSTRREDAEDLEHELWLHIEKKICQYDPAQGRGFHCWLKKVCYNLQQDRLKKASRLKNVQWGDYEPTSTTGSTDGYIDLDIVQRGLATPFSQADWMRICEWRERNQRDAVTVICGYGLQQKLESGTTTEQRSDWHRWLSDIGIEDSDSFHERLSLDSAEKDVNERLHLLADELGLLFNSMWQDWNRKRHLILDLDFFWQFMVDFLHQWPRFGHAQARELDQLELQDRISILSVDQLWPRCRGRDEWSKFAKDYPFRGIAPMLRFLELDEIDDRISLLVNCTSQRAGVGTHSVSQSLRRYTNFRKSLRT